MCLQNPEHRHLLASSLSSPNFDVLRRPWVGLLDSEEKSHAELLRTKIGGIQNVIWSQNELDFNVFNNWSNLNLRYELKIKYANTNVILAYICFVLCIDLIVNSPACVSTLLGGPEVLTTPGHASIAKKHS